MLTRRLLDRLTLERNLWNWSRQLSPLRAVAASTGTRTALFCDLMTMPATAKVESLIAGLLRLKGYGATVLLERPNRVIERIFRAAAKDTAFIYLSDECDHGQVSESEHAAAAIIERCPDLPS